MGERGRIRYKLPELAAGPGALDNARAALEWICEREFLYGPNLSWEEAAALEHALVALASARAVESEHGLSAEARRAEVSDPGISRVFEAMRAQRRLNGTTGAPRYFAEHRLSEARDAERTLERGLRLFEGEHLDLGAVICFNELRVLARAAGVWPRGWRICPGCGLVSLGSRDGKFCGARRCKDAQRAGADALVRGGLPDYREGRWVSVWRRRCQAPECEHEHEFETTDPRERYCRRHTGKARGAARTQRSRRGPSDPPAVPGAVKL